MNPDLDIEIDACKASISHLKKTGFVDYNNVNNLCYETCAHWFGPESNANGTECYKNCNACVTPFIYARGHDTCYFRPRPPPVYTKPSYFRDLYIETSDKNMALKLCKDKCEKFVGQNGILECKQTCDIDADALVGEHYTQVTNSPSPFFDTFAKDNPVAFYSAFSVVGLILVALLTVFIWVLVREKKR